MIYDGICPKIGCGGRLVEAAGLRVPGGRFTVNDGGYLIKTKCSKCGRLIGYRPVRLKDGSQDETADPWIQEAETGRAGQGRSRGRVPKVSKSAGEPGPQRDLLV